jgi:hypothetical protein
MVSKSIPEKYLLIWQPSLEITLGPKEITFERMG